MRIADYLGQKRPLQGSTRCQWASLITRLGGLARSQESNHLKDMTKRIGPFEELSILLLYFNVEELQLQSAPKFHREVTVNMVIALRLRK